MISDTFMSIKVILFKWLSLISSIFFSNVGSVEKFAASKLLLRQIGSSFSSKDVIADGFVEAEMITFR